MPFKEYYEKNLPHWQPRGSILFITFRTFGSLPSAVEQKLVQDAKLLKKNLEHTFGDESVLKIAWKRLFKYADDKLDSSNNAMYLRSTAAAQAVVDTLYKGEELHHYILHRYCIMPNHVHLLIEPLPKVDICGSVILPPPQWPPMYFSQEGRQILTNGKFETPLAWRPMGQILKSIKGTSSRKIGQLLSLQNPVWRSESFDHWVRNEEEYNRIIKYIDENPVKAGLCTNPQEWEWSTVASVPK